MHPSSSRVLTATLLRDRVLLSYRLGVAVGIKLLSRRGSETEFSTVAEDEASPVIDDRPKLDPDRPESRTYRAIVTFGSGESQLSDEIKFTVP